MHSLQSQGYISISSTVVWNLASKLAIKVSIAADKYLRSACSTADISRWGLEKLIRSIGSAFVVFLVFFIDLFTVISPWLDGQHSGFRVFVILARLRQAHVH